MYQQNRDPLGNAFLSTIVAAFPILTLLHFIALQRHRDAQGNVPLGIAAPCAALFGVIAAFLVSRIAFDRRLQAALIAFSFGAIIEATSGIGTSVAIAGAVIVGLGFKPFQSVTSAYQALEVRT